MDNFDDFGSGNYGQNRYNNSNGQDTGSPYGASQNNNAYGQNSNPYGSQMNGNGMNGSRYNANAAYTPYSGGKQKSRRQKSRILWQRNSARLLQSHWYSVL